MCNQILRNGAIQAHDRKMGARALPKLLEEVNRRTLADAVLGWRPMSKSTVCEHRRRINGVNILLERQALAHAFLAPTTRLCITADNTPDKRGHELNGQVYTVPTCDALLDQCGSEMIADDGYRVPVEG
jgi:hypothetical protein